MSYLSMLIKPDKSVKSAMRLMSTAGHKEVYIVTEGDVLAGVLSDGDIRKWILQEGSLDVQVIKICNHNPKFVFAEYDLDDVKALMLEFKIESVPVVDHNKKVIDALTWDRVFDGSTPRVVQKIDIPVVIMAGGKGTRLDPFTRILPKPLIPIGEKPVIEIIMDKLYEHGMNQFFLVLNHKAAMIKSYIDEAKLSYDIHYVQEKVASGTVGGIKLLPGHIKDPFLVTNCDVIVNAEYGEILKFHQEHHYDLTLVVCCRHYVIPYGVCEIEQQGTLKSITEKPEYDLLINTGIYILNKALLELVPPDVPFNMTELISKAKAQGYKVGAFPVHEQSWIDIGQWDEYQKAIKILGG